MDIARALIDHPDILFLDEPTTGLDLQTRIVIWDLLQKLQKEQGLTIFLTTHYLEEAENADQMYILENGNVLAEGSAEEIKEMYAPNRLLIRLKQGQTFSTNFKQISKSDDQIEIDGLNSNQVIDLYISLKIRLIHLNIEKGQLMMHLSRLLERSFNNVRLNEEKYQNLFC